MDADTQPQGLSPQEEADEMDDFAADRGMAAEAGATGTRTPAMPSAQTH